MNDIFNKEIIGYKSINDIPIIDKIILFNKDIEHISNPCSESLLNNYIVEKQYKYLYHNRNERIRCFYNPYNSTMIKEYTNIVDISLDKVFSGFISQIKLCYPDINMDINNLIGEEKDNNDDMKFSNNICKVYNIKLFKNKKDIDKPKNNHIHNKDYSSYEHVYNKLYITYEYCGDDLFELNNKYKITGIDKRNIIEQMIGVTKYMKMNNYYHPDLKLENCCLNKDKVLKIIDFDNVFGTIQYMPPEKENIFNKSFIITESALVWMLTVFIYDLYTKQSPFYKNLPMNENITESEIKSIMLNNILSGKWYMSKYEDINYICCQCLILNPNERPSLDQFTKLLKSLLLIS